MGEDERNIELEGGGELSPGLDLVAGEDQLPHLGAHDHAHHRLLDEGPSAASVGARGDQQLSVIRPCIISLVTIIESIQSSDQDQCQCNTQICTILKYKRLCPSVPHRHRKYLFSVPD